MQLAIYKSKLPQGLSHVIKTSQLKEALDALNIELNVQLNYTVSRAGEKGINVFECLYWLPNSNVPYTRFYITTGTVSNKDRKPVSDLMITTVIPQFTAWVKYIALLPANSTLAKHNSYFRVRFKAGAIAILSDVEVPQ